MARTFRGYSTEVWDPLRPGGEPGTFSYKLEKEKKASFSYEDALNHFNWNNGVLTDTEYAAYLTERLANAPQDDTEYFTLLNKLQQVFNARENAKFSALGVTAKDRYAFAVQKSSLMQQYLAAAQAGDATGAAAILKKIESRDVSSKQLEDFNDAQRLAYSSVQDQITDARASNDLLFAEGKITAADHLQGQLDILEAARGAAKEYGLPTNTMDADIAQQKRKLSDRDFSSAKTLALSKADYLVATGQMDATTRLQIEQQWVAHDIQRGNNIAMEPAEIAKLQADYVQLEKRITEGKISDAVSSYKDAELQLEYQWKLGMIPEEQYVAGRQALLQAIEGDSALQAADPERYASLYVGAFTGAQSAADALSNRRVSLSNAERKNAASLLDLQTKENPILALAVADEKLRLYASEMVSIQNQLDALAGSTDPDAATKRENLLANMNSATADYNALKKTLSSPSRTAVYNPSTGEYKLQASADVTGKGIFHTITLPDGTSLQLFFKADTMQVSVPTIGTDKNVTLKNQTLSVAYIPVAKDENGNIVTRKALLDPNNDNNYFFIDGFPGDPIKAIQASVLNEYKLAGWIDANGNPTSGSGTRPPDIGEIVGGIAMNFTPGTEDAWTHYGVLMTGKPLEVNPVSPYVAPPPTNPSRAFIVPQGMRTMLPSPESAYPGMAGAIGTSLASTFGVQTWGNFLAALKNPRVTQEYATSTRTGLYGKGSGMYARGIHGGYDLAVPVGTPLPSLVGGQVITVMQNAEGWGGTVVVKMANGSTVRYAHMSKITVQAGQFIQPGALLGLSGNTGNSTGPHVHVEMKDASNKVVDTAALLKDSTTIARSFPPVSAQAQAQLALATRSPIAYAEDGDARTAAKLDAYLQSKGSPMAGQGATFVQIGKQYGVDPQFLVAITGADSSYGKNLSTAYNPGNVFNNDRGDRVAFGSWREGIEAIAKYALNGKYLKGFSKLGELVGRYATGSGWFGNISKIYAQITGNPVTATTTFRIPPGSSSIGATAQATGTSVPGVTAADVQRAFQAVFYKQATQADIAAWTSSGLTLAGFQHQLQQFQEAKTKRVVAKALAQNGVAVDPTLVNAIYVQEKGRIESGEQPDLTPYIGAALELRAREAAGLPTNRALTVEEQAQLNQYKDTQPAPQLVFDDGNAPIEQVGVAGAVYVPGQEPVTPQLGGSYIGPDGQPITFEELIGAQGAGQVLAAPQLAPLPTGEPLAALQRTYMEKTNDTQLANFGSFLDAYRAGQPITDIPTTGRPQTADEKKAVDFETSLNTFIGGQVAGNSLQAANFQDYVQGLRSQGLSGETAFERAKQTWYQDAAKFNQRVEIPREQTYTPSEPNPAAISSIRNA